MHERSNEPDAPGRDRTLTLLDDLIRGVGDDSPPKDKALFTLWAGLQDITNDFPNHRSARIARKAIERAGEHLVDNPAPGACPEHGWRGGRTGAQACPACNTLNAWDAASRSLGADGHPVETWPTASCCGEPRVTPAVDRCYDHATACRECSQPTETGEPMASCCASTDEPAHNTEGGGHA